MSAHARRAFAALLLAAICAAVLLAPFGAHSDDGCQTEIHCLACRLAVAGKAVAACDPASSGPLALVGLAVAAPPTPVAHAAASAVPSRGPPAFA